MMRHLLEMSAGHLSAGTWLWLNVQLCGKALHAPRNSASALLAGGITRYGWIVRCPTEGRDELPTDLRMVLDHARRCGADCVAFDRDMIPTDDLPVLHASFGEMDDVSA